jgi:hypothetical protein
MKIRKKEILQKIESGAVLVKKFDRMYGTYFYLNDVDGKSLYNLHSTDCKLITASNQLTKKLIDTNTLEYSNQ